METKKLTPEVLELLEKQKTWTLATFGKEVNAVPIFFTGVAPDGRLVLGDVFMKQTLENLALNDYVAISVYEGLTGYQLKGRAVRETEGPIFEQMREAAAAMKLTAKGVLLVEVDSVIVTSPGPNVGKAL